MTELIEKPTGGIWDLMTDDPVVMQDMAEQAAQWKKPAIWVGQVGLGCAPGIFKDLIAIELIIGGMPIHSDEEVNLRNAAHIVELVRPMWEKVLVHCPDSIPMGGEDLSGFAWDPAGDEALARMGQAEYWCPLRKWRDDEVPEYLYGLVMAGRMIRGCTIYGGESDRETLCWIVGMIRDEWQEALGGIAREMRVRDELVCADSEKEDSGD